MWSLYTTFDNKIYDSHGLKHWLKHKLFTLKLPVMSCNKSTLPGMALKDIKDYYKLLYMYMYSVEWQSNVIDSVLVAERKEERKKESK